METVELNEITIENRIQQIHTSCHDCLFAQWADEDGPTQKGCALGRIERYREQDPKSVVEAYNDNEEEKEFFVINGRFCKAKVLKPPFELDMVDAVAKMRERLKVKLAFLVLLSGDVSEEGVIKTCQAILKQSIPAHQVFFVNRKSSIHPATLAKLIGDQLGNDVTWRITQVRADLEPPRAIDQAVEHVNAGWYAVVNAGFAPPPNFISDINEALNERLERFSLLTPVEDGNALVVQTAMHKHSAFGGNSPSSVEVEGDKEIVFLNDLSDKIKHYAQMREAPYMVKSVAEVVRFDE